MVFFQHFFQISYIYTFAVQTIYSTEQKKIRQYVRNDKKKKKIEQKQKYDISMSRVFTQLLSG